MKEIKIITIGRPNLESLPKNEAKVFYSTLLSCVLEYFKGKEKAEDGVSLLEEKVIIKNGQC